MLSFEGQVNRCLQWKDRQHRKRVIELLETETGKKLWLKSELIITIDETFVKNKLFPPNAKQKTNRPGQKVHP